MAAENLIASGSGGLGVGVRFNEAAAHGRGKPPRSTPSVLAATSFNEAAAHGRGKLAEIAGSPAAAMLQ